MRCVSVNEGETLNSIVVDAPHTASTSSWITSALLRLSLLRPQLVMATHPELIEFKGEVTCKPNASEHSWLFNDPVDTTRPNKQAQRSKIQNHPPTKEHAHKGLGIAMKIQNKRTLRQINISRECIFDSSRIRMLRC